MLTAEKPSMANVYSRQFISLSAFTRAELVDELLKRAKDRVEPGSLAFEHARHVDADRANRQQQNDRVDGELQPAICGHFRISPGTAARR